jgi:hypothetical protein
MWSETTPVKPPQHPSALGSAEPSSEQVVEGIEIPVPSVIVQQPGELAGEAVEVGEPGTVDDQHGKAVVALGHEASMASIEVMRPEGRVHALMARTVRGVRDDPGDVRLSRRHAACLSGG